MGGEIMSSVNQVMEFLKQELFRLEELILEKCDVKYQHDEECEFGMKRCAFCDAETRDYQEIEHNSGCIVLQIRARSQKADGRIIGYCDMCHHENRKIKWTQAYVKKTGQMYYGKNRTCDQCLEMRQKDKTLEIKILEEVAS